MLWYNSCCWYGARLPKCTSKSFIGVHQVTLNSTCKKWDGLEEMANLQMPYCTHLICDRTLVFDWPNGISYPLATLTPNLGQQITSTSGNRG